MRPFLLLLVLLVVQAAAPQQVSLLKEHGPEFAEWLAEHPEWFEGSCPLGLSAGVYPLDHQVVFLHGDIYSAPGAYRSLLLRSGDGGRSWEEVMQPVLGSSVFGLTFPTTQLGWALVGWAVEGPDNLMVYATVDSGKHWRRLTEVIKPHSLDMPLSLSCVDETQCSIALECVYGPGHVLESKDGGRTWRSRNRLVSRPGRTDRVLARDGTEWKVLESESMTTLNILRRTHRQQHWTTTATLHTNYRRTADGGLEACTIDQGKDWE